MKKLIAPFIIAVLALSLSSCNKTKKVSKRFIKPGEWRVTELSVDGIQQAELPNWEINDCNIYENSCTGEWKSDEGGHSEFVWQFRDKGDTFEISRQAEEDGHAHDHADEEVAEQCYNFSGVYEVSRSKKDEMEFRSNATLGHSGHQVLIKISKL